MKAVELNLSTRPFRNDAPIAVALGVLAIAAVAFTAHNAHAYLTVDTRETTLREELSDHRERMAQLSNEAGAIDAELADVDVGTLESQADFVASVMQERNFSWTRLFNELERVVPWNIRVSSVRPEFTPGSINLGIIGIAKDDGAFFDFQETLETSRSFANVLPTQWERKEGAPDISFNLSVVYYPLAPAGGSAEEPVDAAGGSSASEPAPVKRVVVEDEKPAAAKAAPPAAPATSGPPRSQPPRRRRAARASAATDEQSGSESSQPEAKGPGAGSAAASPGDAAASPADDVDAGRVTNDYAGSTGAIRTRGDAAPTRGVRTVTRPGDTPRPTYDPNNPRNPPEIVRDEQGNPIAIVPRVSPNADPSRVPPTGSAPVVPEPEGSSEPSTPDAESGGSESGGTDDGDAGEAGGSGGAP